MTRRFHEWVFSIDLSTARADDGREIRFSRQERLLLERFTTLPQRLLSRAQLLDVLPRTRAGEDGGERHVDYLVNRLRQHLGDTPREPRFIATQYGEGYRWLAKPASDVPIDAFLVIIPLHQQLPIAARAFIQALSDQLGERIIPPSDRSTVVVAPNGYTLPASTAASFILEISTWSDGDAVHLALMLRDVRTRKALLPLRVRHPLTHDGPGDADDDIEHVSMALQRAIWRHRAMPPGGDGPTDRPLELRLHEATCLFEDPTSSWKESLALLDEHDAFLHTDHVRDLTRAMILGTRIVQQSVLAECLGPDEWDALEADIEASVLPHLPAFAGHPLLELAASRLLMVAGGRHLDAAFALARSGFAATTAFAAALPTLARCHMFIGDFDIADDLYARSIELARPGSEFHVYLLVLRCVAHLGNGHVDALAECRDALFKIKPATRQEMGLWFHGFDARLPDDLATLLSRLDDSLIRRLLYMSERRSRIYFRDAEHRANVLRGFVRHIARHAGDHLIPATLAHLL